MPERRGIGRSRAGIPPPAERFLRFLIGKRIKPETVLKVLGTEETKP